MPGRVHLGDPVNRAHPLNRGLAAWWLAGLRPYGGGGRWYDLTRAAAHTGTLVGGPAWVGGGRPGGSGAVRAVAGSERIEAAGAAVPTGAAAPWTISFWHRTRAFVSLSQVFGFGPQLPADVNGAHRYVLQYLNNYYFWGASADWDTGIAWDVDDAWHHAAFVCDGSNLYFHRDGVQRATRTGLPPGLVTAGTYVTAFGRHPSGTSSPNCDLDDCFIWSRALSAAEAWAWYDQSRRGHPDTLRHLPRRRSFAASVGAPPAGNRRRRVILCGSR